MKISFMILICIPDYEMPLQASADSASGGSGSESPDSIYRPWADEECSLDDEGIPKKRSPFKDEIQG